MPLVFAALSPHPPLLIPEVGGSDCEKVQDTVKALEELGDEIEKVDPEVIVVMSPHNLIYPNMFNINSMARLTGNFGQFGAPGITFTFNNDLELSKKIVGKADKEKIPVVPYDNGNPNFELDHGTLVPLYFLTMGLGQHISVLPIAYSFADKSTHFVFGQLLRDIFEDYPQKVAFIASGDLSHRLLENPDIAAVGQKFDQTIVESLKNKNAEAILAISNETRETAGECGYNSIITLLGVLDAQKYQPEILNYEAPFGVGYLAANFRL